MTSIPSVKNRTAADRGRHKAPPTRPGTPRKDVRRYTRADKEQYALAWLLHGEVVRACNSCGIPRKTGETWMQKAWWPQLVETVRLRHREQLEASWENILFKTTDALTERIDKGDTVVTKDGPVRVPVKAKELAQILDTTHANLRTSRNQPNSISVSATMDLRQLASNFARAGRQYQYTLNGLKSPESLPLFEEKGDSEVDDIDEIEEENDDDGDSEDDTVQFDQDGETADPSDAL